MLPEDQIEGVTKLSPASLTALSEFRKLAKGCVKKLQENLKRQDKLNKQVERLKGIQDSDQIPKGYKVSHALILPKGASQDGKNALDKLEKDFSKALLTLHFEIQVQILADLTVEIDNYQADGVQQLTGLMEARKSFIPDESQRQKILTLSTQMLKDEYLQLMLKKAQTTNAAAAMAESHAAREGDANNMMQDDSATFNAVFSEKIKPFASHVSLLQKDVQQLNVKNDRIQASLDILINRLGGQVASPPNPNAQKKKASNKNQTHRRQNLRTKKALKTASQSPRKKAQASQESNRRKKVRKNNNTEKTLEDAQDCATGSLQQSL